MAWGQRGDRSDTPEQVQRAPWFPIPPSPALSPQDALKTFQIAPGFRVELVASEPLVGDPVAMAFDPDGRIWVVEMRGWMNNVDGAGNDQPVGRVVVLEDTDGDGRMDRSTVFLDGLVMPRAVQVAYDGVLIAAPPYLWFCRDTNGDGRADEKIIVADDYNTYATPQVNPESDSNAPLWNLDNWLYSARYSSRFRRRAGKWEKAPAVIAGQWGLTQDDYGRHFFNTNQDQLRANPLPAHYASRNPNLIRPLGWNVQVATEQTVWPIRVSPGANRGYRPEVLRKDGTLRVFEAACAPLIYRGDLFPQEFYGNAFVVDPVGNLVKRNIVKEKQGILTAEPAYIGREFLASTDERFRPVNTSIGPDGALYVVDMYRGVIEYIHVLTSYNRRHILEHGLESPRGLGRIYRIVPEGMAPRKTPKLSLLGSADLIPFLADANAWRRETAQRLLVEKADRSVVPQLKILARSAPSTVARLHALWTLEGLGGLDDAAILGAVNDPATPVRVAGVRLSEPWLQRTLESPVATAILKRMDDPASEVTLQLALSLSEVSSTASTAALINLVRRAAGHSAAANHPYLATAIVSGLRGREFDFLEQIMAIPNIQDQPTRFGALLAALSGAIFTEGDPHHLDRLFAHIGGTSADPDWARLALIAGIEKLPRKNLTRRPIGLDQWEHISNQEVRMAATRLAATFRIGGKDSSGRPAPPLSVSEQKRFEEGRTFYVICATCHLPTGQGVNGLAPSLVDSRWVLGPPEVLARIILQGKHEYKELSPMPAMSDLGDERIASILTYIRREWGHAANPIDSSLVARVRQETARREGPWQKDELESLLQNTRAK